MSYNESNIKVLNEIEAVRMRVGMYLGNGADGFHHGIYEIIDNAVDEHLAGYGNLIKVIFMKDGYIQVQDSGRGVPFGINKETGKDTLEVIFTKLHAGGKFDNGGYIKTGGLNGVGATVTNFCSEEFIVQVKRDKSRALRKFSNGVPVGDIKVVPYKEKDTGTIIRFKLIPEIFDYNGKIDIKRIVEKCEIPCFLNKDLTFELIDARTDKEKTRVIHYPNGILDYLYEISTQEEIADPIVLEDLVADVYNENDEVESTVEINLGMLFTKSETNKTLCYANMIPNKDGGVHFEGYKRALINSINENLIKKKIMDRNEKPFTYKEISEGMVSIISVMVKDPKFKNQTKDELTNNELKQPITDAIYNSLMKYFKKNDELLQIIYNRVSLTRRANEAASRARKTVVSKGSSIFNTSLPGKLSDCQKGAEYSELFICEGDSAGGSAKQGRDSRFQAILPLRGKILNIEKVSIDRVMNSEAIQSIIDSLGCGIVPNCDPSKCRYDRVYIMTDADVDGDHIRTLLLTFFYRYMKPLIDNEMVYMAQPPLYKLTYKKQLKYLYSDEELKNETKELIAEDIKYNIQRYKGLGEMNPDQLWETTLDPDNRKEIPLKLGNVAETDKIINKLMGEYPELRKEFIMENAKFATLDI